MKIEKPGKKPPEKSSHKSIDLSKSMVKKNKYYQVCGFAIVIILGIIIYSNSFSCSFHFDDTDSIVNNKYIRDLFNLKALWHYSQSRFVGYYTFAINYHFNKLNVWGYHFVSLVIHLINACLVYWLTSLIFSAPGIKNYPIVKQKNAIAFFTALLFVSHPLATQSVTYIVQRLASLVALFYLLSCCFYVKARLQDKNNLLKYMLFAGSFLAAVSAFYTKENAFTLPFSILLCEIFFLNTRKFSINLKDYRIIILIMAFLGFGIAVLYKFSFSIFKPILPHHGNTYTVTWYNYLFTQFSVILKYMQLLILPINQNLDYDFHISNSFFESRTMLSFLAIISLIILAIFLYKKHRAISFGIFWFLITLSVESGIIPLEDLIYEHRTYLPSFGFFLIVSSVIFFFLWNKYKSFSIFIFVIIIGSNSFLTFERNKIWKDNLTLLNDEILKSPGKARPYGSRGDYYRDQGQWNNSIADYSKAIQINPEYETAWHNRGGVYGSLGQWDKALFDYSRAIAIAPDFTKAYYNRGIASDKLGQFDKAIADYTKTIELDPKNTNAYSNRGIAYGKLGKWDKAIVDYSMAISIDPGYANAYTNRGIAYVTLGQWDKSIADFSKAISSDPMNAVGYFNRGLAYEKTEKWEKAVADFSKAVEINQKYSIAYYHRGIANGKLEQWTKAIDDFTKAIEIDPKYAAAYALREAAQKKVNARNK